MRHKYGPWLGYTGHESEQAPGGVGRERSKEKVTRYRSSLSLREDRRLDERSDDRLLREELARLLRLRELDFVARLLRLRERVVVARLLRLRVRDFVARLLRFRERFVVARLLRLRLRFVVARLLRLRERWLRTPSSERERLRVVARLDRDERLPRVARDRERGAVERS